MYFVTIKLSGDIKENPGPQPKSRGSLSICHWNLNSIPAHNYMKLSLLRAHISSISSNDSNLEVPGHTLVRADNPNNTKRGGVCIYYLNSLPLKVLDIQFLK